MLQKDDEVDYGKTPIFTGKAPTKESTDEKTFLFSGWSPEIVPVSGDATYTAYFDEADRQYLITWNNYDGTALETSQFAYGEIPVCSVTPTKPASENKYECVFKGWSPEVVAVTSDATYTAQFEEKVKTFEVEWLDGDGNTIKVDKDIPYGTIPSYSGPTPTKKATVQYSYSFSGEWYPALRAIHKNEIYASLFTNTLNNYEITFLNYDGTVLQKSDVAYGALPTYKGDTPTRDYDETSIYTFSGWSPKIEKVSGNATYTAQYETKPLEFTISL